MDQLDSEAYDDKDNKSIYLYKGIVRVPPLEMVDDILTVSNCGIDSVTKNTIVNTFIETKNLKLGIDKCNKIHVGKQVFPCIELKVHGNTLQKVKKM